MNNDDNFNSRALSQLSDQAHVWWARPDFVAVHPERDSLLSLLDREERERHDRLRLAKSRANYFTAHVLLRLVLSQYVDLPPSAWIFKRTAHGRPEISNEGVPPLRFNLTHTDGLSACIVTLHDDCGIDAEQLDTRHNLQQVAKRMFSPFEAHELEQMNGEKRLRYFYCRWTLREAYVKARGVGLSLPTREIYFNIDRNGRISAQFSAKLDDDTPRWKFELIYPGNCHVISVALASRKTIVRREFNPELSASWFA
jgi:4'-phosphopantetheinyl transferase